ncbi:hypothetical protein EQO05_06065 [Methanosarcina sp. MSH10X1]|uniref:hypothetical protein n=1 Tax=Methanosarcina sp. MSH10X1 TaxID=2507075 RepID=UPI000FFBA288|nr:hypothetical protein [Methanosarcina sp. MSH10X1]RXA20148.1 hypothetical protein EQO05_06065 [Methanosarcina sp. MSH10X1]
MSENLFSKGFIANFFKKSLIKNACFIENNVAAWSSGTKQALSKRACGDLRGEVRPEGLLVKAGFHLIGFTSGKRVCNLLECAGIA